MFRRNMLPFLQNLLLRWKSASIFFLLYVCDVIYVNGYGPLVVLAVLSIGKHIMEYIWLCSFEDVALHS